MKKVYMQPATNVLEIELQTVIAASPNGNKVFTETAAESGAEGFSRKSFSVWSDENEEE